MKTRKERNRYKIKMNKNAYRLVVFKSNNHIYAEMFNPAGEHVKAVNSSSQKCPVFAKSRKEKSVWVGEEIAKQTKDLINNAQVVFDRGGYSYHGLVKILAEAARAQGLRF